MAYESRVKKSLLNARVNLIFFLLGLIIAFFSRKTFLNCLGADFIGLTGTLFSIISFLNLTEFGLGSAISVFLYKPLQTEDQEKIKKLVSLFGYLYRKVGIFIGMGGLIVSILFPFIFKHASINIGIIYYTFYCYLAAELIGYFINYRQILMTADQKNYIITAYVQTAGMIKTIAQIAIAYYWKDPISWISLELIFNISTCIILNIKLNKEYPWLKTDIQSGREYLKQNPDILRLTKKIFVQKMKDFALNKSDEIMIFAFVSLKMVAYYGNYTIIISKINQLISTVMNSVDAGVGQLVAENDKKKIWTTFWELMALRYFIAGITVFALYILVNPFITMWLGSQYLLPQSVIALLLLTVFITQTRGVVDIFNHAYGQYNDVWAAWVEGGINITVTIIAASFWGISGILLGKVVSLIPIIVIWKPYYLFRVGLKRTLRSYWTNVAQYLVIFSICFIAFILLGRLLPIDPTKNFGTLTIYALCTVIPFTLTYFSLLLLFSKGMKNAIHKLASIINKKG